MWCPTEGEVDRTKLAAYYPGDNFVDWVGSDWYNTPPGYSTPLHDGWASFAELFHYDALGASIPSKYTQYAFGRGKPFMVGETSTLPGAVGQKGQWFRDVPAALAAMPNCVGVSFYDCDVTGVGDKDWRVDQPTSDPSNLAGFVAMALSPAFKGRS